MKKILYITLGIAAFISLCISMVAAYAAFQHNPQNEYCMYPQVGCIPSWGYLLAIVFSWLISTLTIQAAFILPVWVLCWLIIKKIKVKE